VGVHVHGMLLDLDKKEEPFNFIILMFYEKTVIKKENYKVGMR
jgi:hypothetical protein